MSDGITEGFKKVDPVEEIRRDFNRIKALCFELITTVKDLETKVEINNKKDGTI